MTTPDAVYRVFSKPDCPHCDRAKAALKSRNIAFDFVVMESAQERVDFLARLRGWTTWPAVFALNNEGRINRFVGGADALEDELSKAA